MNTLREILKEHYVYRGQIIKLAKAEISKTYKGAVLGWSWAIIRPAITIFVYWFAFSIGLRVRSSVEGYPYFLWLIAGMIPWFFMRDAFTGGASSLRRHTYLITKIKFPVSTIPSFVNLSLLIVNLFLTGIMLLLFIVLGYEPSVYWLQIPIYIFMMLIFFNAWGLFAGTLGAMSRDFLNLIKSLSMALFWLSGIMYSVENIPVDWIKTIMLFNPITVVVNGFRNSMIYHEWIWENPVELRNFVLVYVVMVLLAVWAYKKLRKDIPDVL